MAATAVSQLVNAVLASVDSDAGPELVAGWASERLRELTNRANLRWLLRFAEFVAPATIIDGTVTVTLGDEVIVGDATARAAWAAVGSADIAGRSFRIDGQRNWFTVTGLSGSNDLLLEASYVTPFVDASTTVTGAGYKLAKRYNELADGVRHLGIFSHQRLLTPLEEVSHEELDLAMTGRVLVADIPRYWAEAGVSPDGRKLVEIYPYAKTAQLLRYSYYAIPPDLRLEHDLPAEVDLHVLKTGILVDLYRYEFAKALRANMPESGATWRNEMNTMTTRWEDKIREAVRASHGSDTATFQMLTSGFPSSDDRRIRNAYDYVWQRGNRP